MSISSHPRPKPITAVTLLGGARHVQPVKARHEWSDSDVWEYANDCPLYVWAEVRYSDGNGIERTTGIYRRFERTSNAFVIPKDDPREYQD